MSEQMDDLNFLWPHLLERCPRARLGLSRGKPAVFNWKTAFWPLVADSWEEVLKEALKNIDDPKFD